MKQRLEIEGSKLHALVNNAGISPKAPDGGRLNVLNTPFEDWLHVYQVNFFATILLAKGLSAELERARGSIVNVTIHRRLAGAPFRGLRLRHVESPRSHR